MTTICHKWFVLSSQQQNCMYSVMLHMYISAKYLLEKAEVKWIV